MTSNNTTLCCDPARVLYTEPESSCDVHVGTIPLAPSGPAQPLFSVPSPVALLHTRSWVSNCLPQMQPHSLLSQADSPLSLHEPLVAPSAASRTSKKSKRDLPAGRARHPSKDACWRAVKQNQAPSLHWCPSPPAAGATIASGQSQDLGCQVRWTGGAFERRRHMQPL